MPYLMDSPRYSGIGLAESPVTEESASFLDAFGAALRVGNDIGAPLMAGRRGYRQYLEDNEGTDRVKWDFEYNPAQHEDIADMFALYPTEFDQARNAGMGMHIAQGLRDEVEDFQILSRAGGVKSFFALAGSGFLSPLTAIPGVQVGKGVKTGRQALMVAEALRVGEDVAETAARIGVKLSKVEIEALSNPRIARIALMDGVNVDLDVVRQSARAKVLASQLPKAQEALPLLGMARKDFAKAVLAGAAVGGVQETIISSSLRTQEEAYVGETALVAGAFTALFSLPGLVGVRNTKRSLVRMISNAEQEIASGGRNALSFDLGANLTTAERRAVRSGGPVEGGIEAAREAGASVVDQANLARATRGEAEEATIAELTKIRTEGPSQSDLLEFYQAEVRAAEEAGLDPPLLPGQKTAEDFDLEDEIRLQAEIDRIYTQGEGETQALAEAAAARKDPTYDDLLEFYAQRVRQGENPVLPGQKTAADFDAEDAARLQSELDQIRNPGKTEREIAGELARLRESGPSEVDLREWYDEFRYEYQSSKVQGGERGVPELPELPLRGLSDNPSIEDLKSLYDIQSEQALFRGEQLVTPRESRLLNQLEFLKNKRQGKSANFVPTFRSRFFKGSPQPSKAQLQAFFDEEKAAGLLRTEGGRVMTPREERLLYITELMRGERLSQDADVTPVFRGGKLFEGRQRPSKRQLQSFYRQRAGQGTTRSGGAQVQTPREKILLQRLELLKQERESMPTPEFTPVVRLENGTYRVLSQAERMAKAYKSGSGKVEAAQAIQEMLTKGGIEVVDRDSYRLSQVSNRLLDTPEYKDVDLARLIDDAIQKGRFEELPAEVKAVVQESELSAKMVGEGTMIGRLFYKAFRYSPQNRLHTHRFGFAREVMRRIVNNGLEAPGLRTPDIQSRIKAHAGIGAQLSRRLHSLYRSGRRQHGLNRADWGEEVIRTALGKGTGGEGVDQAAKELREFLDSWTKEMVDAGMLHPDTIGRGVDESYIPRFYDFDHIRANRAAFTEVVRRYYGDGADRIVQDMLDTGVRDFSDDLIEAGKASFQKERTLNRIPTDELLDFLYHDPEYIIERYTREAGARLEYARLTPGNPADGMLLKSVKRKIGELYDEEIAKNPDKAGKLQRERDTTFKDLDYVRKYHLGVPNDDGLTAIPVLTALPRAVAALTFLPLAGVASLADTAAAAFHAPMSVLIKSLTASVRDVLTDWASKLPGRELKHIKNKLSWQVRAMEYAHSDISKPGALIDFTGQYAGLKRRRSSGAGAAIVKASGRTADLAMWGSGMKLASSFAKQVVSYNYGHMILDAARRLGKGETRSKKILKDLERIGVGEDFLNRVAKEIQTDGRAVNDMGLMVAHLDSWDPELAREFRASVFKGIGDDIPSPGAAEVPRFFRDPAGSILTQFMSFMMDSNTKFLGRGIGQQLIGERDFRAVLGIQSMVAAGTAIAMARAFLTDRLDEMESADFVMEGIHYSGIGGLLMETHDWLSRSTAGEYDMANLIGARTAYDRYGRSELRPSIPALDMITSLQSEARRNVRLWNGEPLSQRDLDLMWTRFPVLNLPQFRKPLLYMLERVR